MQPKSSGKFVLRIDPKLHESLRAVSQKRDISLNRLCEELIAKGVRQERFSLLGYLGNALLETVPALQRNGLEVIGFCLFGSVVRGESTQNSDIDILIVLSPKNQPERAHYAIWEEKAGRQIDMVLSPQIVSLPSSLDELGSLWLEVALDGIILWDRDGELVHRLSQIKNRIAEGRYKRKWLHGQPYWTREDEAP